jgi:arginase family enzyme
VNATSPLSAALVDRGYWCRVRREGQRLPGLQFVGMDLVEVCPAYDVAEITARAGATIAWEYLCLLDIPKVQ